MSQQFKATVTPSLASDMPPWWINQVREVIAREGHAVRAGQIQHTIEVQNINQPDTWQPLNLQTNTSLFASAKDRDEVLALLLGK